MWLPTMDEDDAPDGDSAKPKDKSLPGQLKTLVEYWKPILIVVLSIVSVTAAAVTAYASRASKDDLENAQKTIEQIERTTKDIEKRLADVDAKKDDLRKGIEEKVEKMRVELSSKMDDVKDRFADLKQTVGTLSGQLDQALKRK